MSKLELKSVDVYVKLSDSDSGEFVISATPQEAFGLLTMPAMGGVITKLVPCYELSEVPEE